MREINDLGFVTAVGVDKAQPPNRFSVTVQIANASSASAKSEQGQTESGVWVGSENGESLFDAVRNLVRISSRRVMWAHNNVIIIGESLAKDSLLPVADFFTHNPELRMKTPVVIARGEAKKYILAKAGMETPSGLSFTYFNDYSSLLGKTVRSNMLTISTALATPNAEPLIAAVSLKKVEADPEIGGKSIAGSESKTIDVSGSAVFNKEKLIGWLSPEETEGIAWILQEAQNTVVTVTDPLHQNQSVSVETIGMKTKIIAKVIEGIPHITISISGDGNIVEEDGSTRQGINTMKNHIEDLVDRKISDQIKTSIGKIQHVYNSDVINLAAIVHVQNDREWHNGLKYKWKEIFPQATFKVRVRIHIRSSILNQEPSKAE